MKDPHPILDPALLARLAEQQTPLLPEPQVAARLKAQILAQARRPPEPPATRTLRATEGEWLRLGPKVEMKLLRADAESRSYLLRLHPGGTLPPHEHPLDEECYVLEGEVQLGEVTASAGDYHLAPRGVPHGWLRSRTGALLFLRGANPGQAGHP